MVNSQRFFINIEPLKHSKILLKLVSNKNNMIEPRRMADMSKEEDSKKALDEFDGDSRIRISFDHYVNKGSEPGDKEIELVDYAVDMSFDELFDEQKAEVGKVTGNARLNTSDGERIGKYHTFEYDPTAESGDSIEDVDGALMGRLGANREDLTEYADSQALRDLDDAANLLS